MTSKRNKRKLTEDISGPLKVFAQRDTLPKRKLFAKQCEQGCKSSVSHVHVL